MGNGGSGEDGGGGGGDGGDGSSAGGKSRLRQRLSLHHRFHRRRSRPDNGAAALLKSADDFAGIALLTLRSAEMGFKDRWLACVSFGEQTFRTAISDHTDKPAWNAKEEPFKAADVNGDGVVSMDELAGLLAIQQEKEPLMNCCPVCGEVLHVSDKLNTEVHLTLCFDEGSGNQIMTGGFLTDKQASSGVKSLPFKAFCEMR